MHWNQQSAREREKTVPAWRGYLLQGSEWIHVATLQPMEPNCDKWRETIMAIASCHVWTLEQIMGTRKCRYPSTLSSGNSSFIVFMNVMLLIICMSSVQDSLIRSGMMTNVDEGMLLFIVSEHELDSHHPIWFWMHSLMINAWLCSSQHDFFTRKTTRTFQPFNDQAPYIGIVSLIGVPLAAYIQQMRLHCVTLSEEYSA